MVHLTRDDVIRMHQQLIEGFGGAHGILSDGTIECIIQRAANGKNRVEEAAILLTTIAQEHPFMDGNRRTASLAADTLLRVNGLHLDAKFEEALDLMLGVAKRAIGLEGVADWLGNRVKRRA